MKCAMKCAMKSNPETVQDGRGAGNQPRAARPWPNAPGEKAVTIPEPKPRRGAPPCQGGRFRGAVRGPGVSGAPAIVRRPSGTLPARNGLRGFFTPGFLRDDAGRVQHKHRTVNEHS
jgi:hypothetical protein